jgi:hypothetical protein
LASSYPAAGAAVSAGLFPPACFRLKANARRLRCSRFNRLRKDRMVASPSGFD